MNTLKAVIAVGLTALVVESLCALFWLGVGGPLGAILFLPAHIFLYPSEYVCSLLIDRLSPRMTDAVFNLVAYVQVFVIVWLVVQITRRLHKK
jgi:hypothetical protein